MWIFSQEMVVNNFKAYDDEPIKLEIEIEKDHFLMFSNMIYRNS